MSFWHCKALRFTSSGPQVDWEQGRQAHEIAYAHDTDKHSLEMRAFFRTTCLYHKPTADNWSTFVLCGEARNMASFANIPFRKREKS